ncbi:MAG TPA: Hsp20/alpha crystallin family protein [Candidatus Cloacimonadota bacterium]|nr:Hsp20/alpha crystallin family protein [Candidatus Cloacimonadota bacterium]
MKDNLYTNLLGIQRAMLKVLGEVSSLTSSPIAVEDAIDDHWHPKCDVFETSTHWVIVMELAGIDKDEISIKLTDDYLRISGTRIFTTDGERASYYNMEIETGNFDRRIPLPDTPIEKDNPKVQYINGMLRIAFPLAPIVERIIPIS